MGLGFGARDTHLQHAVKCGQRLRERGGESEQELLRVSGLEFMLRVWDLGCRVLRVSGTGF